MFYQPDNHHRHSLRLQGHNYAQPGMYYVTILTHERECTLGDIVDIEMRLSENGKIAQESWMEIPKHFPQVTLDEFRVMPNHLHGIIVLNRVRTRHEQGKGVLLNAPTSLHPNEQGNGVQSNESNDQGNGVQSNESNDHGKGLINQTPTLYQTSMRNQPFTDWPLMRNPRMTLGKIVRHFKAKASKGIHDAGHHDFRWHRNYHDHIICDTKDLIRIRRYIQENPTNWQHDDKHPQNLRSLDSSPIFEFSLLARGLADVAWIRNRLGL